MHRKTLETQVSIKLTIDGSGKSTIQTGIGFLDHMFTALTRHSRFNLELQCVGDLEVDDHHTVEDCALALGQAVDLALGDRLGIKRFGSAYAPLDEALARVVIDLSGRPFNCVSLGLKREFLGDLSSENVSHVFSSLAISLRASIHVQVLTGENDHHRTEAAFKALALALREAVALDGFGDIPSTKGVL